MSLQNINQVWIGMSAEDRTAAKELMAEEIARTGRKITIGDIIKAVTPGLEEPEYLKAA